MDKTYLAFFDELRINGFIEGQNLAVETEGFDVYHEQLAARALTRTRLAVGSRDKNLW
jgi:hypothetical protein